MTAPQPTLARVRQAGPADAEGISSALAAAFYEDPVFRWIHPDDARRAVAVREFFALLVDILAQHDDTWTTTDGVVGAALWVPYGKEPMSAEQGEMFSARLAELAGPDAGRMQDLVALHPHDPHEYLWFLGVVPAAQGHGIGSALLAPVLERADRAGVPAYLEATSSRNRALYERHGFESGPEIAVDDSPPLWPMWRLRS
jgi:GNAT superfamily N-acetyltransferase